MLSEKEQILLGLENNIDVFEGEELSAVERKIRRIMPNIQKSGRINQNALKQELGASKQRLQVLQRFGNLPKDVQEGLLKGQLQISDKVLFSTFNATATPGNKLIPTDQAAAVGIRNFINAKYDKFFLAQKIQMLFYEGADMSAPVWETDTPAHIRNGWLTFAINNKPVFNKLHMSAIASIGDFNITEDYNSYEIKNPKWIAPQQDVQMELEPYGSTAVQYWGLVMIYGQEILPA